MKELISQFNLSLSDFFSEFLEKELVFEAPSKKDSGNFEHVLWKNSHILCQCSY